MPPADENAPSPPRHRRTAITMAGLLYGLTTLFLAVGAVNGQNNLLFWAFGMALGGMLVSGFFSGSGMMGLRLRRRLPQQARAGQPASIHYHARNANRLIPLFCVTLAEQRTADAMLRPPVAFLPRLAPGQTLEVTARATPKARGRHTLPLVTASSSFPLGLMRKLMDFPREDSILVLPARLRLRDAALPRPARRGHAGASSPTSLGLGEDFFGVRAYVAGDSPRLIAWRPSARGDELIVRQHGAPPPMVAWVILDAHPDAPHLENERAIALAAAAIELLADRGCSVGLLVEGADIVRAPAPGVWHARRLVALLALLDVAAIDRRTGPGAATVAARIPRDHALLIARATRPAGQTHPARPASLPGSTILESARLAEYLLPGEKVPEVLSEPPAPESPRQRLRRLLREFFLLDPVGDPAMGSHDAEAPAQLEPPAARAAPPRRAPRPASTAGGRP